MHKALRPRDNVDKLYMSRKEGRRGVPSIQDSIVTSIKRLKDYIEKCKGRLIAATRNNTNITRINILKITRKNGKKKTVSTFQATNKRHFTRENLNVCKTEQL